MPDFYEPKKSQTKTIKKTVSKPQRRNPLTTREDTSTESIDAAPEKLPSATEKAIEDISQGSPISYERRISLIDEIATELAIDRCHQIFSEAEYWDESPKWFEEEDETFSDEYQAFLSSYE